MFKPLLLWSKKNYSHLPWRKKRTLYTTLVSELMLQQTTVATVLNHFEIFISNYPSLKELAKSSEEEILKAWKGLGYYRRAKNLRLAAIQFEQEFHGEIPLDLEQLKKVKGVGEYTAKALLSIGADQPFLAIDANLERVLSRLFAISEEKGKKLNQEIDNKIKPLGLKISHRHLNEALMDLGREVCRASKVECENCPMKNSCEAFKNGTPLLYPRLSLKAKEKFYDLELLRVIVRKKDKILAYQKSEKEWLSSQWELPTYVIESEDKKFNQYPKLKKKMNFKKLSKFNSSITKYKIVNYVLEREEQIDFNSRYQFIDLKKVSTATSVDKSLKKNREGR